MKNIKLKNKELPFSNSMALIGQSGSGKTTVFELFYLPKLIMKYKYGIILNFLHHNNNETIDKIINKNIFGRWFFNKSSFFTNENTTKLTGGYTPKKNKRYIIISVNPKVIPVIDTSFFDEIIKTFNGDFFFCIDEPHLLQNDQIKIFKNKFFQAQSESQLEYTFGKDWKTHFSTIAKIIPDIKNREVSIVCI